MVLLERRTASQLVNDFNFCLIFIFCLKLLIIVSDIISLIWVVPAVKTCPHGLCEIYTDFTNLHPIFFFMGIMYVNLVVSSCFSAISFQLGVANLSNQ